VLGCQVGTLALDKKPRKQMEVRLRVDGEAAKLRDEEAQTLVQKALREDLLEQLGLGSEAVVGEEFYCAGMPTAPAIATLGNSKATHIFLPDYYTHTIMGQPLPITLCGKRVYWNVWKFHEPQEASQVLAECDCQPCAQKALTLLKVADKGRAL
jgi:hypothetical protein